MCIRLVLIPENCLTDLVEDYLNEVENSLQYIRTTPELNKDEKAAFFRQVSRHFGSTALCLSGGASFGYYHFGVVRALLDAGLLPRVMSGTSAGALREYSKLSVDLD